MTLNNLLDQKVVELKEGALPARLKKKIGCNYFKIGMLFFGTTRARSSGFGSAKLDFEQSFFRSETVEQKEHASERENSLPHENVTST